MSKNGTYLSYENEEPSTNNQESTKSKVNLGVMYSDSQPSLALTSVRSIMRLNGNSEAEVYHLYKENFKKDLDLVRDRTQ